MAKAESMQQMESCLKSCKFPISKDELIEYAKKQGVDEQMCAAMRQLPNHHFRSSGEVIKAMGSLQGSSRASVN